MVKATPLDRILLLITALLAAYQVAIGIDGFASLSILAYTIAFGVLLIAGLLLIILGFEVLDSPIVVIASTVIPLSLSLGLVWEYLPAYRTPTLAFAVIGFLVVAISRIMPTPGKLPIFLLAIVHGVAGMIIFLLPVLLSVQDRMAPLFSLVGIGGALIGVGGLLLSFLKTGRPILSRQTILRILPGLLLLMMVCYVIGFRYA
jgi:hypothetical protein